MADAIDGFTNSSIQPWLELAGRLQRSQEIQVTGYELTPCQLLASSRRLPPGTDIVYDGDESKVYSPPTNSCQSVCWRSLHLQDPYRPVNLLNCGLWASLASLSMELTSKPYESIGYYNTSQLPNQPMAILQNFTKLGLDYHNLRYLIGVRDQVSWALTDLLRSSRSLDVSGPTERATCSEQGLFSYERREQGFRGLTSCINAICKVRRLDPDLGGIGVFAAAILQLGLAIVGICALLVLMIGGPSRSKGRSKHTAILSAALVEFHKSQCYFASAVAVASIVIGTTMTYQEMSLPLQSFMVVIPLALNGCVPVTATLQILSRYARLSWHVISLAMVSLLLSTVVLARAQHDWGMLSTSSELDSTDRMAQLVCGSKATSLNNLSPDIIDFRIVWLVYSFCVTCFLACVTHHALQDTERGTRLKYGLKRRTVDIVTVNKRAQMVLRPLSDIIVIILWLLCFTYIFFIYNQFRLHKFVSPEWSFGQIVAIAVWVPSVVEFAYMEILGIEKASTYRYPPGWRVIHTLIKAPAGLANLEVAPSATPAPSKPESVSDTRDQDGDVEPQRSRSQNEDG